VTNRRQRRGTV